MGEGAWIEQLLAKKICQWVENATLPQGCASIMLREGTIYCPYHTQMWEVILMESKRKPEVE